MFLTLLNSCGQGFGRLSLGLGLPGAFSRRGRAWMWRKSPTEEGSRPPPPAPIGCEAGCLALLCSGLWERVTDPAWVPCRGNITEFVATSRKRLVTIWGKRCRRDARVLFLLHVWPSLVRFPRGSPCSSSGWGVPVGSSVPHLHGTLINWNSVRHICSFFLVFPLSH